MNKTFFALLTAISLFIASCDQSGNVESNESSNPNELKVKVGANTDICNYDKYEAVCMPVKFENPEDSAVRFLQLDYGIEGFTPEKATEYELIVSKETIDNPIDGKSVKYKLVKILSQNKVEMDDIVHSIAKNKDGKILSMTFNNTKGTARIKFENEYIDLTDTKPASGISYKNDHFELLGKGENVELKKDGKVVFTHTEEVANSTTAK